MGSRVRKGVCNAHLVAVSEIRADVVNLEVCRLSSFIICGCINCVELVWEGGPIWA